MQIEIDGVSKSARAWAIERGLGLFDVRNRIFMGWHPMAAVLGLRGERKAAAHKRLGVAPAVSVDKGASPRITIDGVTKTTTEWSRDRGMDKQTVRDRIRHGWHPTAAVLGDLNEGWESAHKRLGVEPTAEKAKTRARRWVELNGEKFTYTQWSRRLGLHQNAVYLRIVKDGWHPLVAVQTTRGVSREEAHERLGLPMVRSKLSEQKQRREEARAAKSAGRAARVEGKRKARQAKNSLCANESSAAPLDVAMRHGLLDRDEEREAFTRYAELRRQRGDGHPAAIAMRNELVKKNMRLVGAFAVPFVRDVPDRIQDGVEGLIKAVERFEVERGWRFSTFATWWIKQTIHRRYDDTERSLVRVPVGTKDKIKYGRLQQDGRVIVCTTPTRLDAPVHADGDSSRTGYDVMPDGEAAHADEAVAAKRAKHRIKQAGRSILTKRERLVLQRRFGLGGVEAETLDQVGARLQLSRERIRQVEREALQKLRGAIGGSKEAWL